MRLLSEITKEILRYTSLNQGKPPRMVTVPRIVYDALLDDLDQWCIKANQKNHSAIGGMYIAGVHVLPDPDKPVVSFFT